MGGDVVDLAEIDRTQVAIVGGKGARLGELARIDGIRVPPGCCVTTDAFRRTVAEVGSIDEPLRALDRCAPEDRDALRSLSAEVRQRIEAVAVPPALESAITGALVRYDMNADYAVRSSATAEDTPTGSFAGQHDTYLNVAGAAAIVWHVKRCWASLFTERAVTYRLRHGVEHRSVSMAVVVQRMVSPAAAGVLFTADPITSNRHVACVEASDGLGEALVSGLVTPDRYSVRDGEIVARTLAPGREERPALSDPQVVELVHLARRIESHFDAPQDIEWCRLDDGFVIVQSRPITTLYPVPVADDDARHVYVSVGHGQMMTDAMKPLGLSVMQHVARPRMYEAGGRLFVDVAPRLASPATRAGTLEALGRSDPLIGDALQTIVARGFVPAIPDDAPGEPPPAAAAPPIETDAAIVAELIERNQASIAAMAHEIRTRSGPDLIDFIVADIKELKRLLFEPLSHQVLMAGMEATWWLNERFETWLGEKNAADTLTQSAPGNITSEMGLALLDVADVIRPHPDVVSCLERVEDEAFLDDLGALAGGPEVRDSIEAYLDRYGMRCVAEIDITRPRWSERPSTLVPLILGNVRTFDAGEGQRRFARGRDEAQSKEQELLARVRELPGGEAKAEEAKRMIDRVRTFIGYREHPKYGMVSRYFVYKQALGREAARLVKAGVLAEMQDIFYLTLPELHEATRGHHVDDRLIRRRMDAFRSHEALTPPRVLTSEGEVIAGSYRRGDVPADALIGLPVCAGTVEGRARVIRELTDANFAPGDILVTTYTDPSWSALFVAAAGLVTEVGGLMSHGAVIAREYGLPAVVGVEHATRLIGNGQRIRVHGTDGYVELLP